MESSSNQYKQITNHIKLLIIEKTEMLLSFFTIFPGKVRSNYLRQIIIDTTTHLKLFMIEKYAVSI